MRFCGQEVTTSAGTTLNSLPRHDLKPTYCVNKEVDKFNRQLTKIFKLHGNVKFLDIEAQRKHFTKHGQLLIKAKS
jgi:hypothetical protein